MEKATEERFIYEISCLKEDENEADFLTRILRENNIEIISEKPFVKINAAYPIKKRSLFFCSSTLFSCEPALIQKLYSNLKQSNQFLRFMIRRVSSGVNEEVKIGVLKDGRGERRRMKPIRPSSKKNTEAVLTNEALQEKIEEILK